MADSVRKRAVAAWLAAAAMLQTACTTFGPAPAELRAALDARAPAAGDYFDTGTAVLQSERWNGQFHAGIAWRSGPEPQARLQLFNDVGAKTLDVILGTDGAALRTPGDDEAEVASFRDPDVDYGAALFFGLTLAAELRPNRGDVVLGATRRGDGWLLELAPLHPRHTVWAECDPEGHITAFLHDFGWASWRFERRGDERRLVASGIELRFVTGEPEPAEEPHDDELFDWRPGSSEP